MNSENIIDEKLVSEIAETARLDLSEEEKSKIKENMKNVLEAFSVIEECSVEDEEMSVQPIKFKNKWRDDKEEKCLSQEEALSQTKHKKESYFKGPKSI